MYPCCCELTQSPIYLFLLHNVPCNKHTHNVQIFLPKVFVHVVSPAGRKGWSWGVYRAALSPVEVDSTALLGAFSQGDRRCNNTLLLPNSVSAGKSQNVQVLMVWTRCSKWVGTHKYTVQVLIHFTLWCTYVVPNALWAAGKHFAAVLQVDWVVLLYPGRAADMCWTFGSYRALLLQ